MNKPFSSKEVKVGNKCIGGNNPIYIIADLGLTNSGRLDYAHRLIDVAKDLGVDAVKFQMIGPDILVGDRTVEYTYLTVKDGYKTENMYQMFKGLEFSENEWFEIHDHCKKADLEFICTAHYIGALDILQKIPMNIQKICTWSASHKRLIKKIGGTKLPLLLDTGVFCEEDFDEMVNWYFNAGGSDIIVLHDFHTKNHEEMNFLSIPFIKSKYQFPVGYTPQGRDSDLDFLSIGAGVNLLEKRLTLDRSIPKNGHYKALEPLEFKVWLKRVKELESAMGCFTISPTQSDLEQSKKYFKSLWLNKDIEVGEQIKQNFLEERRPGIGISAKYIDKVLGKCAKRKLYKNTMLKWDDFE